MPGHETHVLHVVRTLGKGGGLERNLYRIVAALVRRGQRHSIALLSDFPDIIDFSGLAEVHRISTPPNDPWLVAKLRRLITRLGPTVLHARNFGAWPDVAVARLTLWPRPPLIFSYHGMEADLSQVPLKHRLAFQGLAPLTTRIFAVSAAARRLLQEQYGLARHPIEVIGNGVDTDRYAPDPAGPRRTPGPLIFGSTGRLHEVKNFGMMIEAAAQARREGLAVEVHLAGEGYERPKLEELAAKTGVPLRLLGYTEDVPGFLRGLDVFGLSSHSEASPNVLLEAMAAGLPAIATDVGGVTEVTDEGRAVRLVPKGDVAAMSAALLALGRDPAARVALGERARSNVLERHSQARMFDAYQHLYEAPRERRG
jgi:glycosyltransferase involved in cell wall biosynthesis